MTAVDLVEDGSGVGVSGAAIAVALVAPQACVVLVVEVAAEPGFQLSESSAGLRESQVVASFKNPWKRTANQILMSNGIVASALHSGASAVVVTASAAVV